MPVDNIQALEVGPETSLREVMSRINTGLRGIALVVDTQGCLIATLTDGDLRRAILAGLSLDTPATGVIEHRGEAASITAAVGTDPATLARLMREHSIRQIPLLDAAGRVSDLITLDDLLPQEIIPQTAVIMAGGVGARLRPFTDDTPKPMLPVGGRPLMELIVERLRRAGIQQVTVATHYKSEKIVDHFGDGENFGVKLNYVTENQPLGTAGALGLLTAPAGTTLVMNGDILTEVDFRAMLDFHREHKAVLTIAVRKYDVNVPYGIVERSGALVARLVEKPTYSFFVNAGIYLLEPEAYRYIPAQRRLDMTDLVNRLLAEGQCVANFPVIEYWMDIGQQADYELAQAHMQGRVGA